VAEKNPPEYVRHLATAWRFAVSVLTSRRQDSRVLDKHLQDRDEEASSGTYTRTGSRPYRQNPKPAFRRLEVRVCYRQRVLLPCFRISRRRHCDVVHFIQMPGMVLHVYPFDLRVCFVTSPPQNYIEKPYGRLDTRQTMRWRSRQPEGADMVTSRATAVFTLHTLY